MDLYLHIGAPKCGSTTIQNFLTSNKSLEEICGISQLQSWGHPNSWKIAANGGTSASFSYWVDKRKFISRLEYYAISKNLWVDVANEAAKNSYSTVVASSEYICAQFLDDIDAISTLHTNLAEIFNNVTILFYVRDPINLLKSGYAQSVKGPQKSTLSFDEYVLETDEVQAINDYYKGINVWSEIFGAESIKVGVLNKEALYKNDLLLDFMKKIGVPEQASAGIDRPKIDSNVSPSYTNLKILRNINVLERDNLLPSFAARALKKALLSGPFATLGNEFPANHDALILRRCSTTHRGLINRFLPQASLEAVDGPQS